MEQFYALTGIRALAAVGVLFCHFSEINADRNLFFNWGWLDPLLIHGAIGVDVFFVLSGFILAHVYRRNFSTTLNAGEWFAFMRYRLARLYPVHLTTMLVMLAFFAVGAKLGTLPHHVEAFTPLSFLANLAMTHAWFPGYVAAMNGPAWSISAEWFAYLLFPLLYFCLNRAHRIWPFLMLAISAIGLANLQNISPLKQIALEFPLGMAAFQIYHNFKPRTGAVSSLVAIGLIAASAYLLPHTDPTPLQKIYTGAHLRAGVALATALLLVSLTNPRDVLGRVLSTRLMVYAGEISYSIYMCHWAVWTALHKGAAHLPAFQKISHLALMLIALIATLACAMLCYHFIELPGRSAIRRFGAPRVSRKNLPASAPPINDQLAAPGRAFAAPSSPQHPNRRTSPELKSQL